ncbi:MAG TPA: DUF3168 domain-containing protein [Solirubrobacterales bacterium]|nr:DUF3168 domain-containing protein [Solirubrobacterales bacterium]
MIPNAEAILGAYLREHPAVEALKARVVPETPSSDVLPWVKVTQHDALAVGGSRTDYLIEWFGTFDCYAGTGGDQATASLLTRTVREALLLAPEASFEGATVTGVRFTSCPRLPDTYFEPAMQRYALSAIVWMHP